MDSKEKIQKILKKNLKKINVLHSSINFNIDQKKSNLAIKKIISTLNEIYPLAGFVNARFQEDFLLNMREFEHRYYIQIDCWVYYYTCVSIIEKLINIIKTENEFKDILPVQKYYGKNQKFSVLSDLDSIFRNAKKELVYYDQYMDHILVEAISDLDIDDITLILSNPSEKFLLFIRELNTQRGKNYKYIIPDTKDLHDRYCLIDGSELWQISGSVNSKNLNSITITKISDEESQDKIIKDINKIKNKE
jgi:hypothetical protein